MSYVYLELYCAGSVCRHLMRHLACTRLCLVARLYPQNNDLDKELSTGPKAHWGSTSECIDRHKGAAAAFIFELQHGLPFASC
jgi:hypothetical protein